MALHPKQKRLMSEFCDHESDRQIEFLRNKYDISDFDPDVILSFRSDAAASYGGELDNQQPFIQLAVHEYTQYIGLPDIPRLYTEYDFIAKNPRIGEAFGNWKQLTAMLMAHEMAHAVCEVIHYREQAACHFSHSVSKDRRAHGLMWQAVYGDLRDMIRDTDHQVEVLDLKRKGGLEVESFKMGGVKYLTYTRNGKPVGYFKVEDKVIFRTNDSWGRPRKTKYKTLGDVRKALTLS